MSMWAHIWAWMQDHAWPEFYDFWDDDEEDD